MFLRLLLAVLMLTGPMPVRVCTCAASATPAAPAEAPFPDQPSQIAKSCGCGHHAKQAEAPDPSSSCARSADNLTTGHTHPERHDRECPAVKPRAAVSEALLSPVPDAPADPGFCLPLVGETPAVSLKVAPPLEAELSPPSVPLYISLLSLRN